MERIKEINFAARFKQIHENDSDAKFCFILGAGASKASGIRTGQELSTLWLNEIKTLGLFSDEDIAAWKKKYAIDEKHPELFYGEIYAKRFSDYKDLGYKVLGKEMANKQPSFGYSVLSQIMAEERHNVIITTNFDNLIEAGMYTFTNKKPVVCGHESLAGYASPSIELPLIIKIHRDLLFHPKNEKGETDKLAEEWLEVLTKIFSTHIPVFIGYGGNDGSLMGYLEELDPISKMYWCLYKDEQPAKTISDVVSKHNGLFVETNGFDSLMHELWKVMEYDYAFNSLETTAKARVSAYMEQVKKIEEEKGVKKKSKISLTFTTEKIEKKKSWWEYELMARRAETLEEKEKIYKDGISKTSKPELIGNYALFLHDKLKNYDLAEKYYKMALELDPRDADNNGNYAVFLKDIRKNYNHAEKHYKKALELNPENTANNANYAIFLHEIRKDNDQAEKFYKKALEPDSGHVSYNGNYAVFLDDIRKNYDEAEKYYKKELELNPQQALTNTNYAIFLNNIRKDYHKAERYNKKALELDPEDTNSNANYTQILLSLGRIMEARPFLTKALENCETNDLLLELSYYQYAHFRTTEGKQALETIKRLLQEGERSDGWNFDGNIEQAAKEGHPNVSLLKELATVITTEGSNADKVIKMIDKELKAL